MSKSKKITPEQLKKLKANKGKLADSNAVIHK